MRKDAAAIPNSLTRNGQEVFPSSATTAAANLRERSHSPSKPDKSNRNSCSPLNIAGLVANLIILSITLFAYSAEEKLRNEVQEKCKNNPQLGNTFQQMHAQHSLPMPDRPMTKRREQEQTTTEAPDFHIIFSTGCSAKQDLQAYVLFHSIMESGQTGHATRSASGCPDDRTIKLREIFEKQIKIMAPERFHLHVTPEFGKVRNDKTGKVDTFHYLNKPYGTAHWMEHVLGYSPTTPSTRHDETIVVLLDPDMILVRPFINDFSDSEEIWRERTTYPHINKIRHGYPMAAEYGYSIAWYLGVNDIRDVVPANELPSPVSNMTKKQLTENYTCGPPYMATARDFYKLAAKWRQFSLPVLKLFPDNILAEMYAYSWAAAHLNMPHQTAHSFMVSQYPEAGFQLFDNKDYQPEQVCRGIPRQSRPHVLHYCQRYALGKYILGKHRLPQSFVGQEDPAKVCESPLLAEPPDNFAALFDYFIDPDPPHYRTDIKASKFGSNTKQDNINHLAYLICEESGALNRAALYYKQQHCDAATVNTAKTLIFHETLEISPEELNNFKPA